MKNHLLLVAFAFIFISNQVFSQTYDVTLNYFLDKNQNCIVDTGEPKYDNSAINFYLYDRNGIFILKYNMTGTGDVYIPNLTAGDTYYVLSENLYTCNYDTVWITNITNHRRDSIPMAINYVDINMQSQWNMRYLTIFNQCITDTTFDFYYNVWGDTTDFTIYWGDGTSSTKNGILVNEYTTKYFTLTHKYQQMGVYPIQMFGVQKTTGVSNNKYTTCRINNACNENFAGNLLLDNGNKTCDEDATDKKFYKSFLQLLDSTSKLISYISVNDQGSFSVTLDSPSVNKYIVKTPLNYNCTGKMLDTLSTFTISKYTKNYLIDYSSIDYLPTFRYTGSTQAGNTLSVYPGYSSNTTEFPGKLYLIFPSSLMSYNSITNGTAVVTGDTLIINQTAGNKLPKINFTISSKIVSTDTLCFKLGLINNINDKDTTNNVVRFCVPATSSVNTFTKMSGAYSTLKDGDSFTYDKDRIFYTINFQNLSSTPSNTVTIFDTLDPNLDWGTFMIHSSSSVFNMSMSKAGVLILSSSTANLSGSSANPLNMGFVTFSLKPKSNLSLGTAIKNSALVNIQGMSSVTTDTTYKVYSCGKAKSSFVQIKSPITYGAITVKYNGEPTDSIIYLWGDTTMNKLESPYNVLSHFYNKDTAYEISCITLRACGAKDTMKLLLRVPCDTIKASFDSVKVNKWSSISVVYTGATVDSVTFKWGDGTQTTTASIKDTLNHPYAVKDTSYKITCIVKSRCGLVDSFSRTIHVNCDTIKFSFDSVVLSKNWGNISVQYDGDTLSSITYLWGDGTNTTKSTIYDTVTHSYNKDTSYKISCIVKNHCGKPDTFSKVLYVNCDTIKPSFDSVILDDNWGNISVQYDGDTATSVTYLWGDGSNTTTNSVFDTITHTYNKDSSYKIYCIAKNHCGKLDTFSKVLRVNCDTVKFSFDSVKLDKNWGNISVKYKGDTVSSITYLWGDGTQSSTTSIFDTVTHAYNKDSSYKISCIVKNRCGKPDTFSKVLRVNCDSIKFTFDSVVIAKNWGKISVQYDGDSVSSITYLWGDGTQITTSKIYDTLSHAYNKNAPFKISCIVSNHCGKLDTFSRTLYVNCDSVKSSFDTILSNVWGAVKVKYTGSSTDSTKFLWGDGSFTLSTSINDTVIKYYNNDSLYKVACVSYNHCGNSDTSYHVAKAPCNNKTSTFKVLDSSKYGKISVSFTGDLNNQVIYSWGDGTFTSANPANQTIVHNYGADGWFTIKCISINKCNQRDTSTLFTHIKCDTPTVNFNTTVNSNVVTFTYTGSATDTVTVYWGDGLFTTINSPSTQLITHTYSKSVSKYILTASVKNACGVPFTKIANIIICTNGSTTSRVMFCDSSYTLYPKAIQGFNFNNWSDGSKENPRVFSSSANINALYLSEGGCVYIDSFILIKTTKPKQTKDTITQGCDSGAVVINAYDSTVTSYLWSTGSTSSKITVRIPGLYSLDLYHPCGVFNSVYLVQASRGRYVDTFEHRECNQYAWAGNTYTKEGLYTDTFKTTQGCDSIVTLDLSLGLGFKVKITNDIYYTVDTGYKSYEWYICSPVWRKIANETKNVFYSLTRASFAVVVSNGTCIDTSDCLANYPAGISSNSINSLRFYPNPVKDELTIEGYELLQGKSDIEIHNSIGQVIYQTTSSRQLKVIIPTKTWANGVYFVTIKTDEKSTIEKIIKE